MAFIAIYVCLNTVLNILLISIFTFTILLKVFTHNFVGSR